MAPRAYRDCCILLIAAFGIVELGSRVVAQSSTTPRVRIAQLGAFAGPVWPGDFNGDGISDLASTSSSDQRVAVALGVGDGTFRPPVATAFTGRVLAAADFNGDAR